MKKKREKKNLSNLALFRMTWPNLWRTAPWYVILSTLLGVVFSLIGAAQTLLNRILQQTMPHGSPFCLRFCG